MWSYETSKCVIINHPWLGLVYYSLVSLVLVCQLSWVVYNETYMEYDQPSGILRVRVKSPSSGEWDEFSSVLPQPVDGNHVFISTRVVKRVERRRNTSEWEEIFRSDQEVEEAEHLRIKVDHTMFAPHFFSSGHEANLHDFMQTSRSMEGTLRAGFLSPTPGQVMKNFPQGEADLVTVGNLLQAANSSLLSPSEVFKHQNEPISQRGAVLRVGIHYENHFHWMEQRYDVDYHYRVTRLPQTGYSLEHVCDPFPYPAREEIHPDDQYRYLMKRYGIYVEFNQEGRLGRFSWIHFLLNVFSALGMMGLLSMAVDYVALYTLPRFYRAKYAELHFSPGGSKDE